MSLSIFPEKAIKPDGNSLQIALGKTYKLWNDITEYVFKNYPAAKDEWAFPGKNFGWNYRIRDAKRVIIYMMPCDKFFKVSFVFGAKATEDAMVSKISKDIKDLISSAKVYAEGRGFRIDVKEKKIIKDIKNWLI